MSRWASLVGAIAILTWAASAHGQHQDPRAAEARKQCLTGNVDAGVALLAELFVETRDVNLIYNQARCYEQNGRADQAILRFREYLRVAKKLTADEKAEVDRHIADCRAMKAEATADASSAPTPAPLPAAAPLPPQPAFPPGVDVVAAARPTAAPGSGTRVAGLVLGSAGIAAVATGGLFSYLVSNAKQEAEDNARKQRYDSALNSRGQSYEVAQWICYGTGAALVATGVVLYVVGARKGSSAGSLSLAPGVAPTQGGLLLQGRF